MAQKTILIIEDDLEVCTLYKFFLEREGYITYEAHTAQEVFIQLGLEAAKENDEISLLPTIPVLIILDVMLPGVDGYTVISRFLQHDRLRNIPVIIITAKSKMSDLFVSCSNVRGFFSKPFDPKLVRKKIKEIID